MEEKKIYQKDDILQTTITDVGSEGEGIGRVNGYTLFVKDVVIGDVVQVKIMKAKKHFAYARLIEILSPSKDRVKAPCLFAKQCGGCQLQAMEYGKQLLFKKDKVKNNLVRIGGFLAEEIDRMMEEPVGMQEPFHYRNKAQFPFGYDKDGNIITGFYAGRTHAIIQNTDCMLGVKENKEILEIILDFFRSEKLTAYREENQTGLLRHVLIRKGFTSGQLMVCLIINGNSIPHTNLLVKKLSEIPGMTSISYNINTKCTNVIMGEKTVNLWGEKRIEDSIGGLDFYISPLSFFQVNAVMTEQIYRQALAYADLSGQETVWDLYCGIGTISLFLAKKAKQVYGVEIIPQAIEDARENAVHNQITNAEFFVGKAEEVLPSLYETKGIYADVIVVDPPRKGCEEECLETIVKMNPKRVVYVSCDSATLARDMAYLREHGFYPQKIRTFDNFPQSVHVEVVTCLQRVDM